ncbi:hypothetical protein Lal_00024881 [Lupinus albus]|nr:hypothetical protein Lal_00024881 [Lupinus albus]
MQTAFSIILHKVMGFSSFYFHLVILSDEAVVRTLIENEGFLCMLCKNAFLKDKKQSFLFIYVLRDIKDDLKGKGGLRMAPKESLGEILQINNQQKGEKKSITILEVDQSDE